MSHLFSSMSTSSDKPPPDTLLVLVKVPKIQVFQVKRQVISKKFRLIFIRCYYEVKIPIVLILREIIFNKYTINIYEVCLCTI